MIKYKIFIPMSMAIFYFKNYKDTGLCIDWGWRKQGLRLSVTCQIPALLMA